MSEISAFWHKHLEIDDESRKTLERLKNQDKKTIDEILLYCFLLIQFLHAKEFLQEVEYIDPNQLTSELMKTKYTILYSSKLAIQWKYEQSLELIRTRKNFHLLGDDSETVCINQLFIRTEAGVLALNGKYFKALDKYQTLLRKDLRSQNFLQTTTHDMALVSLSLGQYQGLEYYLENIPESRRVYFNLWLEQIKGQNDIFYDLIHFGIANNYPQPAKPRLFERILLSLMVLGNEQDFEEFKSSQILQEGLETKSPHLWIQQCLELTKVYFSMKDYRDVIDLQSNDQWPPHDCLWFYFKKMLVMAKFDKQIALQIISEKIEPLCKNNYIFDPVFPYLKDSLWFPLSSWSQKLAEKLQFGEKKIESEYLGIIGSEVCFYSHEKIIKVDFSKRPTSLKTLRILAGTKGHAVTKKDLHEQLTASKYNKNIHDNRQYQLLHRLSKLLESNNIMHVFYMPGDHTIILNKSIYIEK